MTKLGLFLSQRSVNKSEAARKAGLSKARMNELTLNDRSHLRAEELYLIALAIGVDPGNLLEYVCADLNPAEQLPLAADEETPYETAKTKKKRK
ncbi:helix-turn-helix domain-containing protein [Niabella hibiscisoli]|jgi:DNA-binding Xre family transcriptional regulator|uniref:helix-turn-helix domain-containing protein n=1 Tax=Niabella hibiscisoli TaxID=1825928 RepID=UPI001F100756|nr:helix-turn-helix transcriptional regulator [Niabella hibiscisoli]MCH5716439.1 helix-turn-helix transcriptional regulator [Niabella hibiscisoli]